MAAKLRPIPWLVCLVLLMAACSGGNDKSTSPNDQTSVGTGVNEAPGLHGDPDEDLPGADRGPEFPEDAFIGQRILSGVPSLKALGAAAAQARQIRTATNREAPLLTQSGWRFQGPKTVGGRVVDAAVDPQQKGGLYVATSTAGIWHSTDSGATFTSVWPDDLTHAMGAIAIAPNGTLYVGTGETNPGGGSITYGGNGMYRSTDGGATWKHVGLRSSGTIGRIVIDPQAPQRVWVAVSGNLFLPGGQRGVYVSDDGGDSWQRSLTPPNDTTGGVDISIDPGDSDHLVAAMWDHLRKPDERRYTGVGSGIWETHNGGSTWKRLGTSQGLPASADDVGRIGVTFAPSNGNRLYAIYANNAAGSFQNFFRSTDNGASWTRAPGADDLTSSQSTYGWWFARIFVNPDDAKRMYVAGLNMYQSTDGADNFSGVGGLHADQHIAVWDTHTGGDVYIGNDGGLYASANGGSSWTHSSDEPWSQYVSLDVSEQDPTRFLGGLQDNGTRASWTNPPFQDIIGGDGERALISPTDKNTYYGCYQYGNCTGFSGGSRFAMPFEGERFPFFMQMELQPGDPSVIYGGGNELNRSTDGGHSFTVITDDLGHGGGGSSSYPYGTISAIGLSPSNPKVIWVGTDNGYLYRSTDKGASFVQLPAPVKPRLWITRITIDPNNTKSIFITFSGYRSGDNSPYVLHSVDSGATWTDISANLPKAPVSELLVIGGKAYVGTDVGVFSTTVADPRWRSVGHGLPQLIITDLRYLKGSGTLFASTFGMGVWSVAL